MEIRENLLNPMGEQKVLNFIGSREYHPKVIDAFKFETNLTADCKESDTHIILFCNGEEYVRTTGFRNLSFKKKEKIKEKLEDLTNYNKTKCESESQAIAYLDMIFLVENIVASE